MRHAPAPAGDSTGDGAFTPVRVTARLAEPVVGLAEHAGALDGPAAFGAFLAAQEEDGPLPPMGHWALDFPLPLAVWTRPAARAGADLRLLTPDGLAWGWACSRALYSPGAHGAVEIRRRPPTGEMARFTRDAKHHAGLGPYKARDTVHPAVLTAEIHWFALAEPAALRAVLGHVTHLGRATRHGHGRVLAWDVVPDEAARDGWARRAFPHPGGAVEGIRAPYWHPSRRMPCRG